jgi:hypothetical protein
MIWKFTRPASTLLAILKEKEKKTDKEKEKD